MREPEGKFWISPRPEKKISSSSWKQNYEAQALDPDQDIHHTMHNSEGARAQNIWKMASEV
jgi:hypothetical protein